MPDQDDKDLKMVWWMYHRALMPAGYQPTGPELARAARDQAREVGAGAQTIRDAHVRGETLSQPDDDKNFASMTDEIYAWYDLAERLEKLTDAEAYALYVRARELRN